MERKLTPPEPKKEVEEQRERKRDTITQVINKLAQVEGLILDLYHLDVDSLFDYLDNLDDAVFEVRFKLKELLTETYSYDESELE